MVGFVSHSSSVGRIWVHLAFKVKYCHEIFEFPKGYAAKMLLREFPWLKRQYFWGGGLWNPSYYFDSLGSDLAKLSEYVRRQGVPKDQSRLASFLAN